MAAFSKFDFPFLRTNPRCFAILSKNNSSSGKGAFSPYFFSIDSGYLSLITSANSSAVSISSYAFAPILFEAAKKTHQVHN